MFDHAIECEQLRQAIKKLCEAQMLLYEYLKSADFPTLYIQHNQLVSTVEALKKDSEDIHERVDSLYQQHNVIVHSLEELQAKVT